LSWTCDSLQDCDITVQASDGDLTGSATLSLSCTNTLPVASLVTITPSPLFAGDPLTCTYAFVDADADPEAATTIAWTVNGAPAGDGPTLDEAPGGGGEVVCEVTPRDGAEPGLTATKTVFVGNTAPSLENVSINPPTAQVGQPLTCDYIFADVDDDADQSQVQWLVNGSSAGSEPILAGSAFASGDTVECIVTPNDGVLSGAPMRATATARDVHLVREIGFYSSSSPSGFQVTNGHVIFRADDGVHGAEPWVTDGIQGDARLLMDLNSGASDSYGYLVGKVGSLSLLIAQHDSYGRELWVTDGTAENTQLLADINPGELDSDPGQFLEMVGILLFVARGSDNLSRIGRTDGTPSGTWSLDDAAPGSIPPYYLGNNSSVLVGDALYYRGYDITTGAELWVTDGTAAGTRLVKDINPGATGGNLRDFAEFNGGVIFTAEDESAGWEPWYTDGTETGTHRIRDINPGAEGSVPRLRGVYGGLAYFVADDGTSGGELWSTDGTEANTKPVADISPGAASSYPTILAELDGSLYLYARTEAAGSELWISDGTPEGTQLLKDIAPGTRSSQLRSPYILNGRLCFAALTQAEGWEIWVSDGTPGGTMILQDTVGGNNSDSMRSLTQVGELLFFWTGDRERDLWVTDGTPVGTREVKFDPIYSSYPTALTVMGDELALVAQAPGLGQEIWLTDGTELGTRLLKDIAPGNTTSSASSLTMIGDQLYFGAYTQTFGHEPWVSGGTEEGTVMLENLNSSGGAGIQYGITAVGDLLLFRAISGISSMWVSDGTFDGTRSLDVTIGTDPQTVALNGVAYFIGQDETRNDALWTSDGTFDGTQQFDVLPGEYFKPEEP